MRRGPLLALPMLAFAVFALAAVPIDAAPDQARPAPTSPPLSPAHDVLPRSMSGTAALRVLRAPDLSAVAARNGRTVDELTALLADDPSAWLDARGNLFFQDAPPPSVAPAVAAPAPFPADQTFRLHSRPGSTRVLYLDFDGYELLDGNWWTLGPYLAAPFDTDGSPSTWSQPELDTVQNIYLRVAEDYAPFDIDVTTQDPGAAAITRSSLGDDAFGGRVVVTDSPNGDICGAFCAGVSFVGNVDAVGSDTERGQPSWVFSDSSANPQYLANNASHEFGHAMGLDHDGNPAAPIPDYDVGHGMWAPLMGWGFAQPVSQWSRGEYTGATNQEDDFAVAVRNGVRLVADDAGSQARPSNDLVPGRTQLIGVMPGGDIDTWRYVAPCSGTFTFTASVAAVSPNLSLELRLSEPRGTAVTAADATQPVRVDVDTATGMGAGVTGILAEGSASTLTVLPLANGTPATGWSNYGNVGRYSLAVAPTCDGHALPVLTPGASGVLEGDAGRTTVRIPISLSRPADRLVTVPYRTATTSGAGLATARVDYLSAAGVVVFRPGETVKSVAVTVLGDTVDEPPLYLGEWILIQFGAPSANAELDLSTLGGLGVGVIVDDD